MQVHQKACIKKSVMSGIMTLEIKQISCDCYVFSTVLLRAHTRYEFAQRERFYSQMLIQMLASRSKICAATQFGLVIGSVMRITRNHR